MELAEVLRRRRMVRRFDGTPLDPAVRDRVLAAAVRAPSAGFTQGWAFVVLEGAEQTERFWQAAGGDVALPGRWLDGMRKAPLLVLPLSSQQAYLERYAEPDKGWTDRDPARWPVPYWHVDAGMAALLMLLTAVDEGLGGCLFGIPADRVDAVRAELSVPAEWSPVGVVAVGHPEPGERSRPSRERTPLEAVLHRGRWQGAPR